MDEVSHRVIAPFNNSQSTLTRLVEVGPHPRSPRVALPSFRTRSAPPRAPAAPAPAARPTGGAALCVRFGGRRDETGHKMMRHQVLAVKRKDTTAVYSVALWPAPTWTNSLKMERRPPRPVVPPVQSTPWVWCAVCHGRLMGGAASQQHEEVVLTVPEDAIARGRCTCQLERR